MVSGSFSHDVFISHASEDKSRFVRPLAEELRSRGLSVWYDEWELRVGDSLVERIGEGLARSRFGVVVLSPAFFTKNWSRAELQAFAALEMRQSRSVLLPVWLDVDADEIADRAPLLLGRVALRAADGVGAVAEKLAARVRDLEPGRFTYSAPPQPTLYPDEIRAQEVPNSHDPPLGEESGFVFRTVGALRLSLTPDQYLGSQQKRSFQAIASDSSIEGLLQELADRPGARPSGAWVQALPNTGTVVTISRPQEEMSFRGGTVEARSGLHLRFYATGTAQAVINVDLVLRAPDPMEVHSLLSLDDFYKLLAIPAMSLRDEVAPVVTASLSGSDEPTLIAQSVVAMPVRDEFSKYLDLSTWANDQVVGADGPFAVHWNATSWNEIATPGDWKRTVIRMIDRLFSDGSYLEYEPALRMLDAVWRSPPH